MLRSRRSIAAIMMLALACLMAATSPVTAQVLAKEPGYVLIVLYPNVYNTEFMAPYDIFNHAGGYTDGGLKVLTVAATMDPIVTYEGLKVIPDVTFDQAPKAEILVVPSGDNSEKDMADEVLINWIRKTSGEARLTMSHCWGAFLLAKAGILDNTSATTYPPDTGKFKKMFPEIDVIHDAKFVDSGKVITSAGGVFSFDASLYAVRRLYGDEAARKVAHGLVIEDWNQSRVSHVIDGKRAGATKTASPPAASTESTP